MRKMKDITRNILIYILFVLITPSQFVIAEQITNDSLRKLLQSNENDTIKIRALNILSWQIIFSNPDSTLHLAKITEQLAQKVNYKSGLMDCYNNTGVVYYFRDDYATAIEYFQKGLVISKEINSKKGICNFLNNIGLIHWKQSSFDIALDYYNESKNIAKEVDDKTWLLNCLVNIGNIHLELNNNDSALVYFNQTLKLSEKVKDKYHQATIYANIGVVYERRRDFKSSLEYYNKAMKIARELSLKAALTLSLTNISSNYIQITDTLSSEKQKKEYLGLALDYATEALDISKETQNLSSQENAYLVLADIYRHLNKYNEAYSYLELYMGVKDSILNESKMKEIENLEAKFRFKENDRKIKILEQENQLHKLNIKNKEILLYSAIIIIVAFIILIIVIYNYLKNKQLIEKREILHKKELEFIVREKETEKKINNAVILSENVERKRIAEDLHDTIGPLLSAIKLYVSSIVDYENSDDENKKLITYTNGLIDDSISNVRSIAHNLMPSSLQVNGLINTLKAFCYKLTVSGSINVEFDYSGSEEDFDELLEIHIYRVITELINNTIKHAEAQNISISIFSRNSTLFINYDDDGKGFDNSKNTSVKMGMGMSNIKTRILSVSGICKIETSPRNGFAIRIEIPLSI